MLLGVFSQETLAWGDGGHDVFGGTTVAGGDSAASLNRDAQIVGEFEEKCQCASGFVVCSLDIEGKAAVEHLWEEHEVARVHVGLVEHHAYLFVVGWGIFPGDIELDKVGVRQASLSGSGRGGRHWNSLYCRHLRI